MRRVTALLVAVAGAFALFVAVLLVGLLAGLRAMGGAE
jgi:hypothetical protein